MGRPVAPRFGTPVRRDLPLDYYLIFAEAGDWERRVQPCGILIEEFVLRDDYTAAGLDSAGGPRRVAPGGVPRR